MVLSSLSSAECQNLREVIKEAVRLDYIDLSILDQLPEFLQNSEIWPSLVQKSGLALKPCRKNADQKNYVLQLSSKMDMLLILCQKVNEPKKYVLQQFSKMECLFPIYLKIKDQNHYALQLFSKMEWRSNLCLKQSKPKIMPCCCPTKRRGP